MAAFCAEALFLLVHFDFFVRLVVSASCVCVCHCLVVCVSPLPWRAFLNYPTCISYLTRTRVSLVSRVSLSLYIDLYLAILQQIQHCCIPLYPTASSAVLSVHICYLLVSSCIQLYPAVSHRIPPPRKRDMAQKIHSRGRGRGGLVCVCIILYALCVQVGGGRVSAGRPV